MTDLGGSLAEQKKELMRKQLELLQAQVLKRQQARAGSGLGVARQQEMVANRQPSRGGALSSGTAGAGGRSPRWMQVGSPAGGQAPSGSAISLVRKNPLATRIVKNPGAMQRLIDASPDVVLNPALQSMLRDDAMCAAIVAVNPGGKKVIEDLKQAVAGRLSGGGRGFMGFSGAFK
jgi:hypothetical protein